MLNFNIHVPTRIHFGRGKIEDLGKELLTYGNKVLLVYGGAASSAVDFMTRYCKFFKITILLM